MKFITLPLKQLARQDTLLWQNKEVRQRDSPTTEQLNGMAAFGKDFGIAVGMSGTILRYNKDTMEFEADPQSGVVTTNDLTSVSAISKTNVVAVGEDFTILTYDGSTWSLSADSGKYPDIDLWAVLHAVYFILAGGYDTVTGELVIFHKGYYISGGGYADHANWTEVWRGKSGIGIRAFAVYEDNNMPSMTAYWHMVAVGDNGVILDSVDWGNTWNEIESPTTKMLYGVGFAEKPPGFAVGEDGTVVKFAGETFETAEWEEAERFTDATLWDILPIGSDEMYVVGTSGVMYMWDGLRWNKMATGYSYGMTRIAGTDKNFIWICGAGGFLGQLQTKMYPSAPIDSAGNVLDYRKPEEETIVDALEIRDTNAHDPDSDSEITITSMELHTFNSIKVVNALDKDITVQVYGNFDESTTNADTMGSAFTVAAGDSETRTIVPDNDGWAPYIYLKITATATPTSGSVTATIKKKPLGG